PILSWSSTKPDMTTAFRITLQRATEQARVTVDSSTVAVFETGRHDTAQTYSDEETAWCVYEANLQSLLADGFSITDQTTPQHPRGSFASWPETDEDHLHCARWRDGKLLAISVDAADPVALHDGTRCDLSRAKPLGRFDKQTIDPLWLVDHMIRRVCVDPRADGARVGRWIAFEHDRFIDALAANDRRHQLTHLMLIRAWRDHARCRRRMLADAFPAIEVLPLETWS